MPSSGHVLPPRLACRHAHSSLWLLAAEILLVVTFQSVVKLTIPIELDMGSGDDVVVHAGANANGVDQDVVYGGPGRDFIVVSGPQDIQGKHCGGR